MRYIDRFGKFEVRKYRGYEITNLENGEMRISKDGGSKLVEAASFTEAKDIIDDIED